MNDQEQTTSMSEKERERRKDPRSAQELIAIALTEEDEHAAWDAIHVLQSRVRREDFEAARVLCHSANARERRLGADILGQFGYPHAYPEETMKILTHMLGVESDPSALHAIIIALYHQKNAHIAPLIAPFKDHPATDVRDSVAFALGVFDDDLSIKTLIELSDDPEMEVRDWATFGLACLSKRDSVALRQALVARLDDRYDAIRAQEIVGLAVRGDERAYEPLVRELAHIDEEDAAWVSSLLFQAAAAIGNASLLPALDALEDEWGGNSDYEAAVARCMGIPANDDHGS